MKRAIVMVGKETSQDTATESYQLLIDTKYISTRYDETEGDHYEFLEEVSQEFADRIINQDSELSVAILNGLKIDGVTSQKVKIEDLDAGLTNYFRNSLTIKLKELSEGRALAIPIPESPETN